LRPFRAPASPPVSRGRRYDRDMARLPDLTPTLSLADLARMRLKRDHGYGDVKAMLTAARIGSFLLALSETYAALGHWPSRSEYATHWHLSERQVSRDWSAIERGLGVRPNDPGLRDWLIARRVEGATTPKTLADAPAPAHLADYRHAG
jgi:hypothetical protein